jgi:hypothetical protein
MLILSLMVTFGWVITMSVKKTEAVIYLLVIFVLAVPGSVLAGENNEVNDVFVADIPDQ